MHLGLGIDAGGTYTDAVLLDFDTGAVVCKAKALTTYPNLAVGIAQALEKLEHESLGLVAAPSADQSANTLFSSQQITLVAVSTTLATNAIVEGKGGRVCLLAIGYLPNLLEERGVDKQPFVTLRHIAGGHNTAGEEQASLDLAAAERAIEETKEEVDAYAVVALGSPFNPTHEIQLVEQVREKTNLPVVSGIEFSRELDSIKRATTALFNARLTPLVHQFTLTMQRLLSERGVTVPLMIVKGDGHLMRAELAIEHPIETVLSGPAASFIGGCYLSGCQAKRNEVPPGRVAHKSPSSGNPDLSGDTERIRNGIVIDMGGTTTDIAVLQDGFPRIAPRGAVVGGWRTCVRAAEIRTSGIGGDSHLQLDRHGEVTVGPRRVIPLAFAAAQYPGVLTQLKELESAGWDSALVQPCDFLMYRHDPEATLKPSPADRAPDEIEIQSSLIGKLQEGPRSLWHLATELGTTHPSLLNTAELESRGELVRIGLTPTDVLHWQGRFTDWSVEAAQIGVRRYAKRLGVSVEEAASILHAAIDAKIVSELVVVLLNQDGNGVPQPPSRRGQDGRNTLRSASEVDLEVSVQTTIRDFLAEQILDSPQPLAHVGGEAPFQHTDKNWSIDFKVHRPLIGIGAPAHAYLPRVASALKAEMTIPEHADVANAVGAIVSGVVEAVEIDVHPVYNVAGIDRYEVRSSVGIRTFKNREPALQHAMKLGEQLATEKAKRAGAEQVEVKIERNDQEVPTGPDSGEPIYLGTQIRATGIGKRKQVGNGEIGS